MDSDRQTKIPLYAQAGIPEVWLVNLPADAIERYREPGAGGYADVRTVKRGETLMPVRLPGVSLKVEGILGSE